MLDEGNKIVLPPLPDALANDVLVIVQEAHKAKTAQMLRQNIVYGVGALMESVSCVWTELDINLFKGKEAAATLAEINDSEINVSDAVPLFNQYAWQHPVITHVIHTNIQEPDAISISDLQSRSDFKDKELYQLFYSTQFIEDQLSVGYVKGDNVIGISVNRARWGFQKDERNALSHIARCVFPFYRLLRQEEQAENEQQSLFQINANTIIAHKDMLGITTREAELLTQIAYGKSNKQIAAICGVSEGTVRKHLENAFRKLGVTNRICAIIRCMETIGGSGI